MSVQVDPKILHRYRELTVAIDSVNRTPKRRAGVQDSGHSYTSVDMVTAMEERVRLAFAIANASVGLRLDAGRGK